MSKHVSFTGVITSALLLLQLGSGNAAILPEHSVSDISTTARPSISWGPKRDFIEYEQSFRSSNRILQRRIVDTDQANDTAYLSWHGMASKVQSWVVLASNKTAELSIHSHYWAQVPAKHHHHHHRWHRHRLEEESSVFVGQGTKHIVALALDGADGVLGATDAMDLEDFVVRECATSLAGTEALTRQWREYVVGEEGQGQRRDGRPVLDRGPRGMWRHGGLAGGVACARSHPMLVFALASGMLLAVLAMCAVRAMRCTAMTGDAAVGLVGYRVLDDEKSGEIRLGRDEKVLGE